jgi:RNA polymerase sigma factor (sigma-70 family)
MLRHKRRNYSLEAMEERGVNMESRMAVTMPKLGDETEGAQATDILFEKAIDEIQNLPENYRIVMTMREIEKKKYEDISKELGWKQNTVRTRIRKGRELLRQNLISNYPELVKVYAEQFEQE